MVATFEEVPYTPFQAVTEKYPVGMEQRGSVTGLLNVPKSQHDSLTISAQTFITTLSLNMSPKRLL